MPTIDDTNIYTVDGDEIELARRARAALHDESGVHITTQSGNQIQLPASALKLLESTMDYMSEGSDVVLGTVDQEIGTQQAADQLGVSRPYMVKLLDNGTIPFRMVGRYRRIARSDVLAYKEESRNTGRKHARELTRLAQEMGTLD